MERLGICWEGLMKRKWESCFAEAARYYEAHGDLNMPCDYAQNGVRVWKFLNDQRSQYRKGSLSADKVTRLEAIGIVCTSRNKGWEECCNAANSYFKAHGNIEVPADYVTESGIWLGKWVSTQRLDRRRGRLTPEQVHKLYALDKYGRLQMGHTI